jgi:hypothetical protein
VRSEGVATDTLGLRPELYIVGLDDLAKALFHFDDDAGHAAESMYMSSGSWVDGMPPRFAVLPDTESKSPSLEMLEQMRAIPLLFTVDGDRVSFRELDRLLKLHIGD